MTLEVGLDQVTCDSSSVVTVGAFDGVHLGHESILTRLVARAKQIGGVSTLVTFDPHPREVLYDESMRLLTTTEEKAELLARLGIQRLVVVPFTHAFAALRPEDFVDGFLCKRIGLREIIVGYDHRFGKGRAGDAELLRRMASQYGFGVTIVEARLEGSGAVSSNRIRQLLAQDGNVRRAQALLGRPYDLTGTVLRGEGRGRTLGYPTANLALKDARKIIPKQGVYAVRGLWNSHERGGMMNIGVRPTFGSDAHTHVEVHLFDTTEDLYGQTVRIRFVDRIRDEIRFQSLEALRRQLSHDESECRSLVS